MAPRQTHPQLPVQVPKSRSEEHVKTPIVGVVPPQQIRMHRFHDERDEKSVLQYARQAIERLNPAICFCMLIIHEPAQWKIALVTECTQSEELSFLFTRSIKCIALCNLIHAESSTPCVTELSRGDCLQSTVQCKACKYEFKNTKKCGPARPTSQKHIQRIVYLIVVPRDRILKEIYMHTSVECKTWKSKAQSNLILRDRILQKTVNAWYCTL